MDVKFTFASVIRTLTKQAREVFMTKLDKMFFRIGDFHELVIMSINF